MMLIRAYIKKKKKKDPPGSKTIPRFLNDAFKNYNHCKEINSQSNQPERIYGTTETHNIEDVP